MNALLAVLLAFPAVLMYHRIDIAGPGDRISERLTVSPAQFAAELRVIHRIGVRTIDIGELTRDLAAGHTPARAVLLTFDDGYRDQFRYAFPLLERSGDRATFFVNTGTIGTPNHLTWREVETMWRAGMSIECHGVDHADLAILSIAVQSYEINGCLRALRAHLRSPVLAYAYPSGDFDAQTIELEQRGGLLLGFTTDPRFQTEARSPYQIVRIRIMSGIGDAYFASLLQRSPAYVDFANSVTGRSK